MPKGSSKKRAAEDYESDGGFVEDAPRNKKTKNVTTGRQVDDEGNPFWELSRQRRVQVTEFRGTTMVGIREFYDKDGKSLPGKKGISLSLDQFAAFLQTLPEIEAALKEKGKEIPRPDYTSISKSDETEKEKASDDESKAEPGASSKVTAAAGKANYEGTSEEEGEE